MLLCLFSREVNWFPLEWHECVRIDIIIPTCLLSPSIDVYIFVYNLYFVHVGMIKYISYIYYIISVYVLNIQAWLSTQHCNLFNWCLLYLKLLLIKILFSLLKKLICLWNKNQKTLRKSRPENYYFAYFMMVPFIQILSHKL